MRDGVKFWFHELSSITSFSMESPNAVKISVKCFEHVKCLKVLEVLEVCLFLPCLYMLCYGRRCCMQVVMPWFRGYLWRILSSPDPTQKENLLSQVSFFLHIGPISESAVGGECLLVICNCS